MRVIRFAVIVVVVMLALMMLSGWGGYLMGRDAVDGVAIGERQVGVTNFKQVSQDQKAKIEEKQASAREGMILGGLLGIAEGLMVGVAIGWGDLYFSKKKAMAGSDED